MRLIILYSAYLLSTAIVKEEFEFTSQTKIFILILLLVSGLMDLIELIYFCKG